MSGNKGCRIGNWVEEKQLEAAGVHEKTGYDATFNRLIYHMTNTAPKTYQSTTHAAMVESQRKNPRMKGLQRGPRDKLLEERFLREAIAEEKRQQDEVEQKRAEESNLFKALGDRKIRGLEIRHDDGIDTEMPVSIYTQRLIEGAFFVTPSTSKNPFARNTGFSNSVQDATKFHLDCDDGAADLDVKGAQASSIRAFNESQPLQRQLVGEIQDFIADTRNLGSLDAARCYIDEVGITELTQAQVRKVIKLTTIPLNEREVNVISLYFEGESPEYVLSVLGEKKAELDRIEEECSRVKAPDAFYYKAVVVTAQHHEQQEVEFAVPFKASKQRLLLPHDTPVIKSILRKRNIIASRVLALEHK